MSRLDRQLIFDETLCTGCQACEVACKVEHDLPVGVSRIHIKTTGPVLVEGKLHLLFDCVRCWHCPDAPCMEACAFDAIKRRADGIVFVEEALCTGCGSCESACPYEAITLMPDTGVPQFCDMCFHRLDEGLEPFCVKHCMSGALAVVAKKGVPA